MSREINLKVEQSNKLKKQKRLEFNKIYHKFNPALIFFATRLLNDRPAAEDIVAETFVKYWKRELEFETVYKIKAFLYISTRNACLNYKSKVNYQSRVHEKLQYQSGESVWLNLNESIYKDVVFLIHSIVKELPERCKMVMELFFFDGLDYKEIARRMGISKNTVRNQITRGLKLIKESNVFQFIKELWDSLYEESILASAHQLN